MAKARARALRDDDYAVLAAFRRVLRGFLAFSEGEARRAGLAPQQHQAILAIRGAGEQGRLTIGGLAEQLLIQHHSAVELVDRLAQAGLVLRTEDETDRRKVVLALTRKAEAVLQTLSEAHLQELRGSKGLLMNLLTRLDAR